MSTERDRYFIAIIPPSPYVEQALEFKNYFKDRYQSKASLNSPPHITLHMPFEWTASDEDGLVEALQVFLSNTSSVKIDLDSFGCFAPRVIFIQIISTPELASLQHQLRQFCKQKLGLFNADYKDLPFHPHITLAFRDLKKPAFAEAWAVFKDKKFEGEFSADRICLMKYEERKWNVFKEFQLTPVNLVVAKS